MKTWEDYKNHVKAISENSGFDIKEMEELVFARKRWIESQMLAYGFQKIRNTYILEKPLLDGDFKTTISVTSKGAVTGNVIDSMTQDEYYQLRQEQAAGAYVHTVRAAYMSLLKDIAASCCRIFRHSVVICKNSYIYMVFSLISFRAEYENGFCKSFFYKFHIFLFLYL